MSSEKRRPQCMLALIEPLERRQLLSASVAPAFSLEKSHVHCELDVQTTVAIATLKGKNLPADASAYHVDFEWGDGSVTSEAQFGFVGDLKNVVTITATHTYMAVGVYRLVAEVSVNGLAPQKVTEPVDVRLSPSGRNIHATAGQVFQGVVGSLSVAPADALYINWGDGLASSPATVEREGGRYRLMGTHTYATGGFYVITISTQPDGTSGGGSDTPSTFIASRAIVRTPGPFSRSTIHAQVTDIGRVLNGQDFFSPGINLAGVPASGTASMVDVNWGDGSPVDHASTASYGTGTLFPLVSHNYARPGSYRARFTFSTDGKTLAQVHRTFAVKRNSIGGMTLNTVTGEQFRGVVGVLTMPAAVPREVGVDWGDGTHSYGTFKDLGNGQYQVTGAHTFANPGSYRVNVMGNAGIRPMFPIPGAPQIEVADFIGDSSSTRSTMNVTGNPVQLPAPTTTASALTGVIAYAGKLEGVPIAQLDGLSQDPYSPGIYAIVDWGDASGVGPVGANVSFQNGKYVLLATTEFLGLSDDIVAHSTQDFDVQVTFLLNDHSDVTKNTVLGSTHGSVHAIVNTPGGLNLQLTHGVAFNGVVGTFPTDPRQIQGAMLDWGDGTAGSQVVPTPLPDGNDSVSASHTYAAAGNYRVTFQVDYANPDQQGVEGVFDVLVSTAIAK